MTVTIDGVRDPQQVSPEADEAIYRYMSDPSKEEHRAPVDDEGVVRYPESNDHYGGQPIPWGGTFIEAVIVDGERIDRMQD